MVAWVKGRLRTLRSRWGWLLGPCAARPAGPTPARPGRLLGPCAARPAGSTPALGDSLQFVTHPGVSCVDTPGCVATCNEFSLALPRPRVASAFLVVSWCGDGRGGRDYGQRPQLLDRHRGTRGRQVHRVPAGGPATCALGASGRRL